jgi:hypothetical protein
MWLDLRFLSLAPITVKLTLITAGEAADATLID